MLALTIPQMDALKRMGIDTSDASMRWGHVATTIDKTIFTIIPTVAVSDEVMSHTSPAYTLGDILNKLPLAFPEPDTTPFKPMSLTIEHKLSGEWCAYYGLKSPCCVGKSPLEAAFALLCFIAEFHPETIK